MLAISRAMGLDFTTMDNDEVPPLWTALANRDFEEAARYIQQGAKLDDLIEEDGNTFLHDAAQYGDLEMVNFFLAHDCPVTLEAFDYIQQTPLIRAAKNGQEDVVVKLLAARVDPNLYDEKNIGNTAIREAVRSGNVAIVKLLLRVGADPTIPGWMNISAVDQAWYDVKSTNEAISEIRTLLANYPSPLRDRKD